MESLHWCVPIETTHIKVRLNSVALEETRLGSW